MGAIEQFFDSVRDLIQGHWVKFVSGLAFMALGWFIGKRRARAEWRRKEFYGRLNVSLNILEPGQPLRIRTLIEKSCEDVFLNKVAAETVVAAARKTTVADPILPLPPGEYWHYLNPVLNELSEKFASGQLARDLGKPVTSALYLVCLTSEAAGDVRTRKVRAMTIKKDVLLALPAEPPPFEHPSHHNRWDTLKALAERYRTKPEQFLEVELSV